MCNNKLRHLCHRVVILAILCAAHANAESLIDPTQPPNAVSGIKGTHGASSLPRWVLNTIVIATDRRVATINGKRVVVGDQISGATVLAIEPSWVKLQLVKSSRTLTLQLLPNEFKRMAETDPDEN